MESGCCYAQQWIFGIAKEVAAWTKRPKSNGGRRIRIGRVDDHDPAFSLWNSRAEQEFDIDDIGDVAELDGIQGITKEMRIAGIHGQF